MDPAFINALFTTLDAVVPVIAAAAVLYSTSANIAWFAADKLESAPEIPRSFNAFVTYSLVRKAVLITVAVTLPPANWASTALLITA